MPNSNKLALASHHGQRPSLGGMLGTLRKALATKAPRRDLRPLQDIDGWSDQTEIAFYEDARSCSFG